MKKDSSKIVYLKITSFIGSVPSASHFFGELQCGDKIVDLFHELSRRESAKINKISLVKYKAGERYPGFETRQEVIDLAKASFKQHFPKAEALWIKHLIDYQPIEEYEAMKGRIR